jgi:hypothetical protein
VVHGLNSCRSVLLIASVDQRYLVGDHGGESFEY